jgi:anti-anti-sigma regulatory factor
LPAILVYHDTPLWSPRPGVLRCTGDEDLSTQPRRRHALTRASRASNDVVVDLVELGFADASLMIDFAMVSRRLRMSGRGLRLRGPQPQVRRLIELVGLLRLPGVRLEDRAAPQPG